MVRCFLVHCKRPVCLDGGKPCNALSERLKGRLWRSSVCIAYELNLLHPFLSSVVCIHHRAVQWGTVLSILKAEQLLDCKEITRLSAQPACPQGCTQSEQGPSLSVTRLTPSNCPIRSPALTTMRSEAAADSPPSLFRPI